MRQTQGRDWKDLVKEYEFLRDFQTFFKSYTKSETPELYDLQLKALTGILNDDRNLLICAPTGSGKTLVFEMVILNYLNKHYLKKGKNCSEFKTIYMAPTHAVCQEKKTQFQDHLKQNGKGIKLNICYLQNLLDRKDKETITDILYKNNIIICTPEMCNYIIRKQQADFIESVNLFLVDEIHMIGCDNRGSNLEIIMNRFLAAQRDVKEMRIACMSASLSDKNLEEIFKWLSAVKIQSKARPVPIKLIKQGNACNSIWGPIHIRKNTVVNNLLDTILRIQSKFLLDHSTNYERGKQNYLIFCITKDMTKSMCNKLIDLKKERNFQFNRVEPQISLQQVEKMLVDIKNDDLKKCIRQKMGYHHADLTSKQKEVVIYLFRKNWITLLFSTSTLAQGVNLPVKVVIILMLVKHEDENGQEKMYFWRQIDQMIGRAGRNKKDELGYCSFIDKTQLVRKVQATYDQSDTNNKRFNFKDIMEKVESKLFDKVGEMDRFDDFLFFETAYRVKNLNRPDDLQELIDHFKRSLKAVQTEDNSESFEKLLLAKIKKANLKFQKYDLNDEYIRSNLFSELYLSVNTYFKLFDQLKAKKGNSCMTHDKFVETICSVDEIVVTHRYQKRQNMTDIRKKFPPAISYKLQRVPNPIGSRNKAIILISIILHGRISILEEFPSTKNKAFQIMNVFKRSCKLVNTVIKISEKFKQANLCDPGLVFFCELYLKYCQNSNNIVNNWTPELEYSGYASHMNLDKCCQLLKINKIYFDQDKQVKKKVKKSQKQNGFFSIKDYFQQQNLKFSSQNLRDIQEKINKYKLVLIEPIGISSTFRLSTDEPYRIYLFSEEEGRYFFKKSVQNVKDLTFSRNDQDKYVILVIFSQSIGLDSVFTYKSGKLTELNLFSDYITHHVSEEKSQSPKYEDEQNINTDNVTKKQKTS